VALTLLTVAAGACTESSRYEPTTTQVDGKTVFVIYPPPPCPANADCVPDIVIDKQFYGLDSTTPKPQYRTGPLFAVGPNREARVIPALTGDGYRVLALRTGSDWNLVFSPHTPAGDAFQRHVCEVLQDLPRDSYCVTKLGFATTQPFDPAVVTAPPGNGNGPAGTCDGTEATPPCGPGVVPGRYYPYTLAEGCDGRAFFDGSTWQLSLRPTQKQPPVRGWIIETQPKSARWTGTTGTDGLVPVPAGPPISCPTL
jgi:hypothetical protein